MLNRIMANEVEAPLIGATLDPDDPAGSAQSVVLGIIGVIVTIVVVVTGQKGYNILASKSDDIPKAVVV